MSHRLAPGCLLLLASCLAGPPPPNASTPTSGSSAASGECGQFKIQSSSDLEACKNKCHDQERDQMKACSGAGCQGGAGTAACMNHCDEGQKSAQHAKCYK